MNEAVAMNVVPFGSEARVLNMTDQMENAELNREVNLTVLQAESMAVVTEEQYVEAGEFLKIIKSRQKKVKDFYEPLRQSTKKAYDDVLSKKKESLEPLDEAEKILKNKIAVYVDEQEKRKRALEEAARKMAASEMDGKIAEAMELEANGDYVAAEFAMMEAQVMEDAAKGQVALQSVSNVKGISKSKKWEIVSIDSKEVPVDFNGMELRPVDEKAVMNLIKASKGKIKIPGITYRESTNISVRV